MDKMIVRVPVAVKAKVTEDLKLKIVGDLQNTIKNMELDLEQFEFQAKKALHQAAILEIIIAIVVVNNAMITLFPIFFENSKSLITWIKLSSVKFFGKRFVGYEVNSIFVFTEQSNIQINGKTAMIDNIIKYI